MKNQYGRDVESSFKVTVNSNNEVNVISSLEVAEMVGRRHDQVLRDIRGIIKRSESTETLFRNSTYIDCQNKKRPRYNLTKEGCEMYARKMRGQAHIKLLKLINETFGAENSLGVFVPERKEKIFIEKLEEALKPLGFILTKQMVVCGKYRVDAAIEALSIVIEYDEYEHRYKLSDDLERQKEIEIACDFQFVRVHERYSDEYNIGRVFKKIMEVSQ